MEAYAYSAPSTSPFYRSVVSPVCDRLVTWIPSAVKPDFVTLVGLMFAAVAALPITPLPVAAGLWILYATADNLDGKHARATKQASIRGEFVDHVTDSATCTLLPLILARPVLGMSTPPPLLVLTIQVPFLVGCWYYFTTGRVILGSCGEHGPLFTVDEVNYLVVPLTLMLGPLWRLPCAWNLTVGQCTVILTTVGCVIKSGSVISQMTRHADMNSAAQTRTALAVATYVGAVWAYQLTPLVVLPCFTWLCSCLIFSECLKKNNLAKGTWYPTIDWQLNSLYPSVMMVIVGVSTHITWGCSVMRVLSLLTSVWILGLDVKTLK